MVVTTLSKTDRKPTLGGKCFKQWSNWLFTGLPGQFQAARLGPPDCFPCPKGRRPKAVLDKSEKNTGVRRETAATYLREAGVALRPPGAWGRAEPAKPANEVATDPEAVKPANGVSADPVAAKPANEMTTDIGAELATQPGCSLSASACEVHRDAIEVGLSQGRNAVAIWQDLVDVYGFAGGYGSVKRFVRKLRGKPSPDARVVIETAPGEEAQVDYGSGPMVRDLQSGKYRRTRLFVLTLGYSRKSVRLLVFRSSSQTWAELHEKAFRRLLNLA